MLDIPFTTKAKLCDTGLVMGAQSRIFRRVTSVLAPAYQVTIQVCPPIWWDHWGPLWSLLMLVPPWPLRHVTAVLLLAPFLPTLLGFMLSFRKITFTGCIYDTASSYRHKYDYDLNPIWPLAWFKKKKIGFEIWSSDMFFGWAKLGFMNFFKFIDP